MGPQAGGLLVCGDARKLPARSPEISSDARARLARTGSGRPWRAGASLANSARAQTGRPRRWRQELGVARPARPDAHHMRLLNQSVQFGTAQLAG